MGAVTQRQEIRRGSYHHGNLPAALAEAAARLARAGGPEAVVLREAARQVGVSPTAAYRHFANHDDLLRAVKERALDHLATRMEDEIAASAPRADPVAEAVRRLRATGRGYLRYALAEPGWFRTGFCRIDHEVGDDAVEPSDTRPYQMMTEILDTLVEHGRIGPKRRPFAEVAAWAAVHGLAVLLVDGPLARLPEEQREAAIDRVLDVIVEGVCQAD